MSLAITPEKAAQHLIDAELDEEYEFYSFDPIEILHVCQKLCTDRGHLEGLSFWGAVYGQYLVFHSHFDLTGNFPDIENDDPVEYLAMMFWDSGWGSPDLALWSAERHEHPVSIQFLKRLIQRFADSGQPLPAGPLW